VQPALFVPETLTGMELLEQFRARSGRMVFVVDEYGVVQGLMTPHDLLEAITGELQPGAQADAWATQRDDGSWLLDGLMPVSELRARLSIRELPDEDRGPLQHRGRPADGGVGPAAGHGRAHRMRGLDL
jgi:putative hemolysin